MVDQGSVDQNRANLQAQLRKRQIKHISFEIYKKTQDEKDSLKEAKLEHNKRLRKMGKNPKRDLN